MSSSGLLVSNLPDRSAIKDNRPFRKRPKSCDEVLTQLNHENMYIPPPTLPKGALPKTSSTAPSDYKCLCAPTTHEGSFRCRLHRVNSQKQSASTGQRLPPSLQILLPSSPGSSVTLKLLVKEKHGSRDSSTQTSLKAVDSKLSRLSKMATSSQMDCNPIPTEEIVSSTNWTLSERCI